MNWPAPFECVFLCDKGAMSHVSVPICSNQVSCQGKKKEGKWQQREFSSVQEGNCNYSSSANVHDLSWFWSVCSLRTPSSLVSPHASQAPVLNRRTCSGSGQHEASKPAGASGWTTCKRVTTFFCPPHSNPHGHIPSCVFFFLFCQLWGVTTATGPVGQRSWIRAMPHHTLGRSGQKPPKYTQMMARDREIRKPNRKEILAGSKQTWLLKYSH